MTKYTARNTTTNLGRILFSCIQTYIKPYTLLILLFFLPFLGMSQTGPGGVGIADGTSNLSLWLDAGTIEGISDGADFTGTWKDQSGNGYDALIGTAPNYSATGGGNGQPSLYFDDNFSEYLYIPPNSEIMPTSEVSVFVAGRYYTTSDSWACFVNTSDDDAWNDGWGIGEDSNTGNMLYYVDDYNQPGYFCS